MNIMYFMAELLWLDCRFRLIVERALSKSTNRPREVRYSRVVAREQRPHQERSIELGSVRGDSSKGDAVRALALSAMLSAVWASSAAAQPAAPPAPPCDRSDPHWVCGQQTPEDLVALPGGAWVVASVYAGTGGINLINVAERASTTVFPGPTVKVQLDKTTYPECPGPPAGAFTTHGVYEIGR